MVDFMVLMPLGTQLMRSFDITPTQLGFFVSIYAVAASLSGFFSALVLDRFDRKTAMLALYACFAATMAACALAPSYATLLAARPAQSRVRRGQPSEDFRVLGPAGVLGVPRVSLHRAVPGDERGRERSATAPGISGRRDRRAPHCAPCRRLERQHRPACGLCRGRRGHGRRGARDDEPAALAARGRGARLDAHVRGVLGADGARDGADHLGRRTAP